MPYVENASVQSITSVMAYYGKPQANTGVEVLNASIVCEAGKDVLAECLVPVSGCSNDQGPVVAMFRNQDMDAFAASPSIPNNTFFAGTPVAVRGRIKAGAGERVTVHVRVGPRMTGSVTVNGIVSSRFGAAHSSLKLSLVDSDPVPDELYVMAGQSNMSGRGKLEEMPHLPDVGRVRLFRNSGQWGPAVEPADAEDDCVYACLKDDEVGASPMVAFGDRMAHLRPDKVIGIVPCTIGGWWIDKWARNLATTELYGAMIARAQAALQGGGVLKGFVWYQGESDATDATRLAAWPGKFTQLISDVRSDLGVNLPAVMTVIGPNPNDSRFPYWSQMVSNQFAMTLPAHCSRVSANDLAAKPDDPPHLTTISQVALGQRMAEAMNLIA